MTYIKKNDIHAIKGAERAHKLLIRLGEHPKLAKRNFYRNPSAYRFFLSGTRN